MKRIFTKVLFYEVLVAGDVALDRVIAADAFIAQEDILVVGAELRTWCHFMPNYDADGSQYQGAQCELSQIGKWGQDGRIISLGQEVIAHSNDVSLAGSIVPEDPFKQCNIMFPSGLAIPIREEGTVYLNVSYWNMRGVGNDKEQYYVATVYYCRGKPTK